jgi:hypothetical protein
MAKSIKRIAKVLGAKQIGQVPDVGGGAFGVERLSLIVASLQGRLKPGQGKRPGRPSDPSWVSSPKVPMSRKTSTKLARLAKKASKNGRMVSPMQLAAQLLEQTVEQL